MTTETLLNTAVVLIGFLVVVAIGVRVLNAMMDDDEPEPTGQGNTPKPPPEPEH